MDAGVSGFPPTAPPAADWPHRRTPWWNTTEARSDALAVRVQGLGEVARADDKVTCEVFPVEARRVQVSPDADAVDALNLGSDRAADIRKHLAASCYAEGRLSLGRATRLSGLGYADFLANLRQRQIPLDHGPDDLRDARVMRRNSLRALAACLCGGPWRPAARPGRRPPSRSRLRWSRHTPASWHRLPTRAPGGHWRSIGVLDACGRAGAQTTA